MGVEVEGDHVSGRVVASSEARSKARVGGPALNRANLSYGRNATNFDALCRRIRDRRECRLEPFAAATRPVVSALSRRL